MVALHHGLGDHALEISMCELAPAFVVVGSMVWIAQPGGGEGSLIVLDRAGAEMLAAAIVDGLSRPDIFPPSFAAVEKKPRSGVRSGPAQRSDPPPRRGEPVRLGEA